MRWRFKQWNELTPFWQGYTLGIVKVYGLVAGCLVGAWFFDFNILDEIRKIVESEY